MPSKLKSLAVAAVSGILAACACAADGAEPRPDNPAGQVKPDAPAKKAEDAGPAGKPLEVTVKSVTGTAQRLVPGEKPKWVAIQAGEKLDELTVLRTGFRTRVVLAFADNSEVVVDRATKMGIAEFRKDGKVTRTRLGLKYGSMRANVHKARGPNDFTVKTAVAALAVLGTELKVKYYQKLQLQGITGVWNATSGHRQRQVKGTEKTDGKLTRSVQLTQMGRSTHLISFFGLGEADRRHLLHRGGGRGIFSFTQNAAGVLLNTPTPDNGSGGKIIVHE